MTTTTLVMSVNEEMADISTKFLYSSALVLTLAMLAFCLDLAGAPGRAARAVARREKAAESSEVIEQGGDTAVVTEVETVHDDAPQKRQWAGIGISLSWLGTLLLGASVLTRSLSANRPPLGNMYEFALVGCLFVMLSYLVWSLRHDVRWLGAFVTGVVVLFEMLAALVFFTDASQLMPSLRSYWLSIHVTVATLSIALFTVAFVLHALWFVQSWRDSRPGKLAFMKAVPDAPTLDRLAYGILIIAFPLWTFTVIAGAVWAQEAWGHYWNWDPKEVWSLVIWVLYAAYLHARMTVGWSGRKSIYVAVAGFVCILINYGIVNVFFVGQHSYSGM